MSGLLTVEQRRQLDRLLAERMPDRRASVIPRWDGDRTAMPLSYAQQRIWFFSQLDPTSPLYNVVGTVRLTGPLDLSAVQAALDEIVRRHEVLRSNYLLSGGQPVQAVRPAEPAPISVVDLSGIHPADRDAEIAERCRREASQPFDLARDLMLRPVFLRLAPDDHLLLVSQHHIAADGWSLGVLMTEFAELYRAFRDGEPSPLAEPALQYGDFAQWQRESLRTRLDSQLSYWTGNLAGARPLDLPGDRVPPDTLGWAGQSVRFSYDAEFVASLRRLGAEAAPGTSTPPEPGGRDNPHPGRATLFMVLTAAFAVVAARWSGQSDFVVGTPIANRNEPAIEPMLGCFVNTLPLRLVPNQAAGFGELLAAVRATCLNGYANQDVPFERIVEAVSPERDARSRTPLVRQMIGLHNTAQRELALPGVRAELGVVNTGLARFDLEWEFTPRPDGGLGGELRYTTDLFSAELAGRIVEAMRAVLTAAIAAPDEPIAHYQLATPAERLRVTEGFLPSEPPADPDPVELCRQVAAEHPMLAGLLDGEQPLRRASRAFARWTAALGPATAEDVLLRSRPDHPESAALGWLLRGLAAGATVVPCPPSATGRQVLELVAEAGVTGCLLGSGLLDELLRDPELLGQLAAGPLRQLACSDTGLSDRLVQRLGQALPAVRLSTVYLPPDGDGPLTACQPATVPDRRPVLLGRPLPGVRLRLLDGCGQLVPVGVPGELTLDGASGTGELARWLPDGNLEYLGPVADAGRRRETVRRALLSVPVVGQATVRTRSDGTLAGYVSLIEPDGGLAASRRDFLTGYASRATDRDPAAHLTGWNSPFTGDYVPAEQMRDWLNGTVSRIRQQQPEHVLQLGCNSVALPSALAAHCTSYRVVDPAIRPLEQLRREHPDIQLIEHPPDDLAGLPAGSPAPDTVLIGISQSFPDARYLRAVLSDAVRLVSPGGRVLLLDVRNLALLSEQHAIGLLRSLPDDAPVTELLRLADGLAEQDELLAVDPDRLVAFAGGLPGVGSVAVLPKLTQHANEVTRFRYDLLVRLESPATQADLDAGTDAGLSAPVALAAAQSCSTVGELRAAVESGAGTTAEVANPFAGALTNSPAAARLARTTAPRIQRQLRDRLPGSLLPGSITAVRHWPLTAAGAVDLARLPEPLQSAELTARPIPPRTDTERTVAEIWQSVLEVADIGVNQDFFALGGHSLLGTQVIDAIQTRFEVELPLARLFESSTIAAVADFIDEQRQSPQHSTPIRRIDRSAFRRSAGNRSGNG